jgi:hypothetical protein
MTLLTSSVVIVPATALTVNPVGTRSLSDRADKKREVLPWRSLTTQISVTLKWQLGSRLRHDTSREDMEEYMYLPYLPLAHFGLFSVVNLSAQYIRLYCC